MTIALYWTGFFQSGVDGKTGLADVVVYIWELSTGNLVVNGSACTEVGRGVYRYTQAAADRTEDHVAVMNTSDATVVAKDVAAERLNRQTEDVVWDASLTGAIHNDATSAGRRLRTVPGLLIHEDTAQGAGVSSNQIQLSAAASAINGAYDPTLIQLIGGTGAGQCRLILEYDGATKIATVDRDWKVNPDATTEYQVLGNPGREHVNEGLVQAATSLTVTLNPLASGDDDAYIGQVIFIRAGTGADQARRIVDYDGTTKIATIQKAWDRILDSTSAYVMLPTASFDIVSLLSGVADYVWDELLASHTDAGSAGQTLADLGLSTPAEIWAYTRRSLTHIAASAVAVLSGATIEVYNYSYWDIDITGLGDLTGRTKLYFTVKNDPNNEDDSQAMLQVEETANLLYFNGASQIADPTKGSLTVTDVANGNATITVDASIITVTARDKLTWEVKKFDATDNPIPLKNGRFDIKTVVARALT